MMVVTHYTVEKGSGAYRIRARDPPMCPACGVLLSGYDTRTRRVVDSSGAVLLFQLGHAGLDYMAAVGCVVSLGYGYQLLSVRGVLSLIGEKQGVQRNCF